MSFAPHRKVNELLSHHYRTYNSSAPREGDALNLDRDTFRQLVYSHAGTRRLVSEVLLIDAIHFGEVVHGGQECRNLSDVNAGSEVNSMALERRMDAGKKVRRRHITLTTRLIELPAASRIFLTLSQHAAVLSAMLPSTRLPDASAGIWPETKMCGPAITACDCRVII